ncbi:hypothetical protein PHLCEN_2v3307 [Hermanssonia centrifuga]|uniref:Beta-glucuronidase C-terminal domain-containing protein n=1 Tax=Hermanssonia centrifuga TaxID=98765 RepID=A0A2R6QM65_9APHY|nr:hypothetical protein PHLCEN_2v3307 [Hermanssonia centrifuga]
MLPRVVPAVLLLGACVVSASITVYGVSGAAQQTFDVTATAVSSASPSTYTAAAFNSVVLQAPEVPVPGPPTQFNLSLQSSSQNVAFLSIPQSGSFFGFSVEFSVVNQVGIPFNDTSNLRLGIAEVGELILGDNLVGFQVGNEPDLYASHGHRPQNYSQGDYFNDFGIMVEAIGNDTLIPVRNNLIAPSVATGPWTPESVWDTGFVGVYSDSLGALAVEHGFGPPKDPQTVFSNYLNHTSGIDIISAYLNSTNFAQQNGKPFLMFETNSASCGGFPGVSDSFGIALWALDYGLQMAYSNFSGALLHVGGEDDTYNWTVGPIFYAAVAVAETFGSSNASQIVDLQANGVNIFTPGYAIYENGNLARVALFNYVTDPTGASTYTASISITGGTVPSQVSVKYLLAPSVAEKTNITWAGQTVASKDQRRYKQSLATKQLAFAKYKFPHLASL